MCSLDIKDEMQLQWTKASHTWNPKNSWKMIGSYRKPKDYNKPPPPLGLSMYVARRGQGCRPKVDFYVRNGACQASETCPVME